MAVDMSFLLADVEFYQPWDGVDPGKRYVAGPLPDGWRRQVRGPWTHWGPTGLALPEQGWKVHVSSSSANAQVVLGVVAAVCGELGVPFKHLAGERVFLLVHDKHAARVQSGKFCTLYPPTEECARRTLRRLAANLAGVSGPFVLTDRRFEKSECVSYRYGAFLGRTRVDAEGRHVDTMLAPDGTEVDDERTPVFRLPPGVADPFREPETAKKAAGPVTVNGYRFDAVIQHSNAGGAYRFRTDADEPVFLKEAKSHNGYTGDGADAKSRLDAEYLVLRAIHAHEPGLCPKPVELFHHWEHSYLVTELVPGMPLYRWMVTNNPAVRVNPTEAEFADYHRRCLAVLDRLDKQLRRLHDLGYVFIDLSPTNVLVDDDDGVRLVDFEAVQRIDGVHRILGTPGYLHPDPKSVEDPRELDQFGLSALALLLLFPMHEAAEHHSGILDHVRADLAELTPIPERLWEMGTRQYPAEELLLPSPEAVRADTVNSLRWLADRTADALAAMADPDHPDRVYPTIPLGYQTDTRALAAGTAGVLLALHRAGRGCAPVIVRRLRDESLAAAPTSAPGFLYGTAGIASVLAELGEIEAAGKLLTIAADHPLNTTSSTWGGGAAGTVMGLLAHYRVTGEEHWLDRACHLLDGEPQLSATHQSGLVGGRTGVALALHHLHVATGDAAYFERGMCLLEEELTYAEPLPVDALGFKTSTKDRRVYPYLFAGSAGYAAVLSRYLALRPDAGFANARDVLEQCLRACTIRFAVFPGLFPGLAGMAWALADIGRRLNRPDLVDTALTSARGLFRHAIPHPTGIRWLGEPGQRFSADLWSGSAGVLLALHAITDPLTSGSTALDAPPSPERSDHHGRGPAVAG
ncbi:class III lanthionine synthetase LanKC [Actinokineospora inagensis]|uniref:class III lanthionine synthetase LanKC n=1 Tax=Actinokineospora inagensis TaxID=103730 RepID=UPI00042635C0|nr:class III lanthionine synthetase LanKC [Actinokineospora inagensis]